MKWPRCLRSTSTGGLFNGARAAETVRGSGQYSPDALRKEPARRYPSVERFARDIQRMLEHRPVLARKDTFLYRAGKFVQRNALALAAGAVIVAVTAGGAAVSLQQARIAGQRFAQVRRLAHSFVFDYSDDLAKLEGTTRVRERMVRTALEYLDNLSKKRRRRSRSSKRISRSLRKDRRHRKAIPPAPIWAKPIKPSPVIAKRGRSTNASRLAIPFTKAGWADSTSVSPSCSCLRETTPKRSAMAKPLFAISKRECGPIPLERANWIWRKPGVS